MKTKKAREPLIALLLSVLITGLGQIYSGRKSRGIVFFVVNLSTLAVLYALAADPKIVNGIEWLICYLLLIAFVVWNYFDAYVCAKEYNETNRKKYKIPQLKSVLLQVTIAVILFFNPVRMLYTYFVETFVVQPFSMPTHSMENTIHMGDRLLVDKTAYGASDPKRGDLVCYTQIYNNKTLIFVKRCIGVPGDRLEMKNKVLYLNGIKTDEPYVMHQDPKVYPASEAPRDNFGPVIVPAGSFFVMGDNRDASADSRFSGFVKKESVKGRAIKIYLPFERAKLL